jgi:hypothetical protein
VKKGFILFLFCTPLLAKSAAVPDSSRFNGFAIALAWPSALAKQTNDWYDGMMRGLGVNDDGYYRVGHAALVLVNAQDSTCYYFDFGRYHTPVGKGRVRDAETDEDLRISTRAKIEGRNILNFDEILCEVSTNSSTHASGTMYSSYARIDFRKAYKAAKDVQEFGPIPYGPFEKNGFNCSRFVRSIIMAGNPNWAHALRLEVVPMITPTTLFPVAALYHWTKVPGCLNSESEILKEKMSVLHDSIFNGTLPQPILPPGLPDKCQWLAGESSGSWFHVSKMGDDFLIKRFSPSGNQECAGIFAEVENHALNLEEPFTISYISHCDRVVILQDTNTFTLKRFK